MGRAKAETVPQVVEAAYGFVLWLLPKVARFPRAHKYTVGEKLSRSGLDLLLALVDANYRRDRSAALESALREVNSIRYLLRLSKDLKLLSVDSYSFAAEKLEEVGRMTGGWRKASGGNA